MTQQSYPFDSQYVGETEWSRMARAWAGRNGVIDMNYERSTSKSNLTLRPFGDGSGKVVKVTPGEAQIRGFHYRSDAEVSVSIASNTSGNPRIDWVVLRLDPSVDSITLGVVQGSPAASPTPPNITQTDTGIYELKVAKVLVANAFANIAADKVLDYRTYITSDPTPAGTMVLHHKGIVTASPEDTADRLGDVGLPPGWFWAVVLSSDFEDSYASEIYSWQFPELARLINGGQDLATFAVPNPAPVVQQAPAYDDVTFFWRIKY